MISEPEPVAQVIMDAAAKALALSAAATR